MRRTLLLALMLASPVAAACVVGFEYPPELENASFEERHRYLWRKDFEESDAVIEVLVLSVEELDDAAQPLSRARVEVVRTWKTDGQPLEVIQSTNDSCGANLVAGSRFIVFAHRKTNFWSFLPWTTSPLTSWKYGRVYVGRGRNERVTDSVYDIDDLFTLLDGLSKGRKPPNNALEQTRHE